MKVSSFDSFREFLFSAPLTKRRWGWISQQERPTNWHLAAAVSTPLIFLPIFCHTLYPSTLPGIQNYNYLICWIWRKKHFFKKKVKSFLWLSVWECLCGPLWDFEVLKVGTLSSTSIVLSARRRHFFVLLKTHPMFLRLLYLFYRTQVRS